jgi:16S rRNA processing protein RimM
LTEAATSGQALRVQPGIKLQPRDALRVGVVTRAHGLSGEIEVRLDWADSRALLTVPEIVLEDEAGRHERLQVAAVRRTPKGVLLSLTSVADRDAAEARRGRVVLVPRAALPDLAPGEYYLSDLIGASVSDATGQELGVVSEVQMYPSVDAVIIDSPSGVRWEQPLIDEWIARVDLEARRIVLASDGGLIELSAKPRSASDERERGARKT